jgi:hypothetical protein
VILRAKVKLVIELIASAAFIVACSILIADAIDGTREWVPWGIASVIALFYWISVFANRWKQV